MDYKVVCQNGRQICNLSYHGACIVQSMYKVSIIMSMLGED